MLSSPIIAGGGGGKGDEWGTKGVGSGGQTVGEGNMAGQVEGQ